MTIKKRIIILLLILGIFCIFLIQIQSQLISKDIPSDFVISDNDPKISATFGKPNAFNYVIWNKSNYYETANGIAFDSSGNIYCAGNLGLNYSTRGTRHTPTDILLVKYDQYLVEQWNRTWDNVENDQCLDIAIDSSDNIYLVGWSWKRDTDDCDLILLKYNQTGDLIFNITWGIEHNEFGEGIAIDSFDNVIVTGWVSPPEIGAYGCLVKFDEYGNQIWNSTWGNYRRAYFRSVTVDSFDNIYVAGSGFQPWASLSEKLFILKYNNSGSLQWQEIWNREYQGPEPDHYYDENVYSIVIDSNDDIIIGGTQDFWEDFGAIKGIHDRNIFVVKFNKTGDFQWASYLAEFSRDFCTDLALDDQDNIYTVGYYMISADLEDFLLNKFNNTGGHVWTTTWGGSSSDAAYAIALDSNNKLYIAGTTFSHGTTYNDMCIITPDLISPMITINSPFENELFGLLTPSYNITVSDLNLDKVWYSINNGQNITIQEMLGPFNESVWGVLTDEVIEIIFYANDTNGNLGSQSIIVRKDSFVPSITINYPIKDIAFENSSLIDFNISIVEEDLQAYWYNLKQGSETSDNYINMDSFDGIKLGTINQDAWYEFEDGNISVTFYANDSAGNVGIAEVTIKKDVTAPTININSPILNELFGTTSPSFNIEIYDINLDIMWYTLDNRLTNTTFITNGTISQVLWDVLSNDTATIIFYANDSAGNEAFNSVTVRVDKNIPTVVINSPILSDLFGITAPSFNVEIGDTNLDTMWYTLDNGLTITTFITNGTINQALWDALPEGNVIIKFYANNSAGNVGFAEISIRKDVTAPIITINNPENSDVIGATAPNFDISVAELNLDKTWVSLNGGKNITFTGLTGTINQTLWDALLEGNVIIIFYANDTLGRIGFQEVTVIKIISQSNPPGIPGYNILLLIGIVSTIAVIIVKKRLNHIN